MLDEELRPQRLALRRARAGGHILRWQAAEILNGAIQACRRNLLPT